ncbi:hypothetical protein BS50DRAFT_444270, partial [Corynespora cassiicola Philippines]
GDEALAGRPEEIPGHFFPPDSTESRTIYFKGLYLSIVNEETDDIKTHIDNEVPTSVYDSYEVPAGYTCYIRGATVYFE